MIFVDPEKSSSRLVEVAGYSSLISHRAVELDRRMLHASAPPTVEVRAH
jgi:hypothetical protein